MKLYRTNGELIADTEHETVKETVLYCIENNISIRGADLSGADLNGADLREADLRGADLNGADLREADLNGADLSGAYLSGAYLNGAKNIFIFNKEGGRTCYAVRHENGLMIQAGCFWGTLDEFETACIKQYGNDDKENYSAQIKYLRSL